MAMQDMLGQVEVNTSTNVDIVFVIDATGSMKGESGATTYIDMVKESAMTFDQGLDKELEKYKKKIANLRIKVIWFRDFYYDGNQAYGESEFFVLPKQKEEFQQFVNGIQAKGGGDEDESSLEALVLAMRSDFVQTGEKKRHIIVLFTDANGHSFEDYDKLVEEAARMGCQPLMYPENMPKNRQEFYDIWRSGSGSQSALGQEGQTTQLDPDGRRLILFTPNGYPWTDMEADLPNLFRKSIAAGEGGKELDMDDVYPMIAASIR